MKLKIFKNILINFITNFIKITFRYHKCLVLYCKYAMPINVYVVEYLMICAK